MVSKLNGKGRLVQYLSHYTTKRDYRTSFDHDRSTLDCTLISLISMDSWRNRSRNSIAIILFQFDATYVGMVRDCERVVGPEFPAITGFLIPGCEILQRIKYYPILKSKNVKTNSL